ncbi:MAG: hypothetical protein IKT08_08390 [Bacteroidales bacterium]|nr:hypothetical protein [Bacteroidales bacterium]
MKRILLSICCILLALSSSAQSPQSYLVSDFNEEELEQVLDLCRQGGFEQLLHRFPFSTYGHYEWNPSFAGKGNLSVARMVQKASEAGVRLGVLVHEDAISLNDSYFSPRYFKQLRRMGEVRLFSDITAEQRDMVIYHSGVMDHPSTLNLILIGNELISYSTMEPASDLLYLHGCSRGLYGTRSEAHRTTDKAYKLWDAPERYCAPDGPLLDSVRIGLAHRIAASGSPFTMPSGGYGQELLNESQRVQMVDRWTMEKPSYDSVVQPMLLGWFPVRVSDRRQSCTTMEDVEWLLAKAAAFDAGYGLLVSRGAMQRHGMLGKILAQVNAWDKLRYAGAFTDEMKESLRDPYQDWHLEQQDEDHFLLYRLQVSRRYRCVFAEPDSGYYAAEAWEWKAEEEGRFGLRIQVEGKGEIQHPVLQTPCGTLSFPCTIQANQYLIYDFDSVAYVTDLNFNKIQEVVPEGVPELTEGGQEVRFSCKIPNAKRIPMVSVRYLMREQPMGIGF